MYFLPAAGAGWYFPYLTAVAGWYFPFLTAVAG
jgi:hypothetical protein